MEREKVDQAERERMRLNKIFYRNKVSITHTPYMVTEQQSSGRMTARQERDSAVTSHPPCVMTSIA